MSFFTSHTSNVNIPRHRISSALVEPWCQKTECHNKQIKEKNHKIHESMTACFISNQRNLHFAMFMKAKQEKLSRDN